MRIRYIDVGSRDGEPVVLIHGGLATAEWQWGETGLIDALDDDYRVVALDLRGHGKSDKPHDVEAYGNAMVGDVVRLLDHLDVKKAHVVGYSLGGRIVFKLVADHPERVASAMPCGTDAERPDEERLQGLQATASVLLQSRDARPILARFNIDGALTEEELDREAARLGAMNDFEAVAALLRSVAELTPDRTRLEANAVPTRCVIGADDLNLLAAQQTAEYMASFELQVLDGESHLTAYRDPAFITAIRAFLSEHALGADDQYFDSAGVKIHYIDVGPRDGEPIVFVHGFTGSIERARGGAGIIDALDDEHRVIAFDLRGHGKSDKPHEPEQYGAEMGRDVIRLLDHLHIERAHLVGYSLGAGIVFKLMADHSDRLLSAMPCGISLQPQSAEEREFYQARARALEQAGRTGSDRDQSDAEEPVNKRVQGFVEAVSRGNDPAALAAVLRSVDEIMPDVSELEHNSVPSLSLFGEHDQVDRIAWTAARMANLEIKIIEGANHFNAPRHPDFIPAITAFVAQHARRDVEEDE
ncbi:MAG: alpha/beta fold hydrolase [Planctomycetota bacterium]